MLNCINKIVENVRNQYYGNNSLYPTGPILMGKEYFKLEDKKSFNIDMCLKISRPDDDKANNTMNVIYNNTLIIKTYKEYRDEQKKYSGKGYYNSLYHLKKIYKDEYNNEKDNEKIKELDSKKFSRLLNLSFRSMKFPVNRINDKYIIKEDEVDNSVIPMKKLIRNKRVLLNNNFIHKQEIEPTKQEEPIVKNKLLIPKNINLLYNKIKHNNILLNNININEEEQKSVQQTPENKLLIPKNLNQLYNKKLPINLEPDPPIIMIPSHVEKIESKKLLIPKKINLSFINKKPNIEIIPQIIPQIIQKLIPQIQEMSFPKKLSLICNDKALLSKNTKLNRIFNKYKEIYSDYKITLYDTNDIYVILQKNCRLYIEKIKKIKDKAALSHIFRYLILYLEGGIYCNLDIEPLKKIEDICISNYFHGNGTTDCNFYIYPKNKKILNNHCDFYDNPCNNYKIISKDDIKKYECLGHDLTKIKTLVCYEKNNDFKIFNGFIITKPRQSIFLKMLDTYIEKIDSLIKCDKVIHLEYSKIFRELIVSNIKNIVIFPSEKIYSIESDSKNSYFIRN
jgi:hypothetical protein